MGDCVLTYDEDVFVYCDDPARFSAILRSARKAASTVSVSLDLGSITLAPSAQQVPHQPAVVTPSAPPAETKRIFVAVTSTDSAQASGGFQVVTVTSGDMDAFEAAVSKKLGVKGSLSFTLDGVGVPITSLDDVQNNDKLLVSVSAE